MGPILTKSNENESLRSDTENIKVPNKNYCTLGKELLYHILNNYFK